MNDERKPELIEKIEKRFLNEWLAIQVTKMDKNKVPLEGILLAHGRERKEVRRKVRGIKEHLLFTFAGDPVPADMEVVLGGNIPL